MTEKQQQLLFDKGITNVPSDALCSDNALEESLGMVYDNGEHRVIQKPLKMTDLVKDSLGNYIKMGAVKYVHKYANETRYITWPEIVTENGSQVNKIGAYILDNVNNTLVREETLDINIPYYAGDLKVESVGKTLIVSHEEGMQYFLLKEGKYNPIGSKLPEPKFDFWLKGNSNGGYEKYCVKSHGDADGMIEETSSTVHTPKKLITDKEGEYSDLVVGLYSKNLVKVAEKKGFCEPFFIRYAIRMFDGTYTNISNPILMFPSVSMNSFASYIGSDNTHAIELLTYYKKLWFNQTEDMSDWSDIIDGIDIFVSDGIHIYETSTDEIFEKLAASSYVGDGVFRDEKTGSALSIYQRFMPYASSMFEWYFYCLKKKDENDIISEIQSTSNFYKVASLGLSSHTDYEDMAEYITAYTLENLTTQTSIESDDYYSRCEIYPDFMYSYNSRLNVANIKRSFFEGFQFFMPWDNERDYQYDAFVTIKTDSGTFVIHKFYSTNQKQGYYFYYPDSRATNVVIKRGNTTILDAKLKEHPSLNGAYYFAGLPGITPPAIDKTAGGSTNTSTNPKELLPNYLVQSEVNNPWVFKAEGYFEVGTNKIIGMSSITQALSEGQFGQFPLLVFSESGIWALTVASTGYYSSIHPISREVCNNNKSITQTDGAVFFSSEKGLMVVVGSQVKCVSEQLSGREHNFDGEIVMGNFCDYLKNCFIAYDYRDSLLWILNNSRTTTIGGREVPYNTNYCYVFSIKSGTFGKFMTENVVVNVVNNYPDYLLQIENSANIATIYLTTGLFTLLGRKNINLDEADDYIGLMITRPMKLENALALKSIMHINHIHDMSYNAVLAMRIFASNNLKEWVELNSLRGVPWLYYRFRYDFGNMQATDRFSGTMLVTQERRTNKPRTYNSHVQDEYTYSITSNTYGHVYGNYIDIPSGQQSERVLLDAQFWRKEGSNEAEAANVYWAMWKRTAGSYTLLYSGKDIFISKDVTVTTDDSAVVIGINSKVMPSPSTSQATLTFEVRMEPEQSYTYSIKTNTDTVAIPAGENDIEAYVSGYSMRTANGHAESFDCYMKMWKVTEGSYIVEAGNPQREGGGLSVIDIFNRNDTAIVFAISAQEISDTYDVSGESYLATATINVDSSSEPPSPPEPPGPEPQPSNFAINLTIVSEVLSNSTGEIKFYVDGHNGIWANLPNANASSNVYAFAAGSSCQFMNVECVGNGVNVEDFEGKPLDGSLVVYAFDGSNHNSSMVTASISGENGVFKNGGSYTITITNYNGTPSPAPTPTPSGNPVISINVNIQNNTGQAVTLDGDLYFVLGNPDHNGNYLGWQGSYNKTGHIYFSDTPVSFGVGETKSFFGISWYDSDTGCGLGEKSPIDPSELQAIGYHHNVAVYVGGNGEVVFCENMDPSIIFAEGGTYDVILGG